MLIELGNPLKPSIHVIRTSLTPRLCDSTSVNIDNHNLALSLLNLRNPFSFYYLQACSPVRYNRF